MIGRAFRRDERGNMAVLFAVGFAVSAVMSAVAVDVAALYHERRQLQAGVDLAAISAAADPSRAADIARAVLVDARLMPQGDTSGLVVEAGRYDRSGARIAERFRPGIAPYNAVRVALNRTGQLHFAGGFAPAPDIGATGIAAITPEVSFSVGSRLASLNGGIANSLLSRLLGTSVSLSVMDYSALAAARVDALHFLDALAQRLTLTAGTYNDLLAMDAGTGAIAAALAGLTTGTARLALNTLALSGQGSAVPLDRLFSLGRLGALDLGNASAVAGFSISALELLSAAAALADGERQVSLALGADVPDLLGLSLDLALGEPPQGGGWFAIGPEGTLVRTAQLRLRLLARLQGNATLHRATLRLPLWLDMAHAEARVVSATCPTHGAPHGSATIAVRPGLVQLALGEMSDTALQSFGAPPAPGTVRLLDAAGLLRVDGKAGVEIAQTDPVTLGFSSTDIANGTLKTARTTTVVQSLANSLLGELDLTVTILGLNLGLLTRDLVSFAVRALIAPLAPTLDMTINAVFSILGLGVGEADVRVYGVRCNAAVLVGDAAPGGLTTTNSVLVI